MHPSTPAQLPNIGWHGVFFYVLCYFFAPEVTVEAITYGPADQRKKLAVPHNAAAKDNRSGERVRIKPIRAIPKSG